MQIEFWGVRSAAAPDPDKVRYGGNTNCVIVTSHDAPGHYFVLDAGTGLARFGSTLDPTGAYEATILLSHVHLYHIIGFQFTPFTFSKASHTSVIGCGTRELGIEDVIDRILAPIYSPVYGRANLMANVRFEEVTSERRRVAGVDILGMPFDHSIETNSWGYRLQDSHGSVVYLVDTDLRNPSGELDPSALRLARNADVLIVGATDPYHYHGEGTPYADALNLAHLSGAKHLIMSNHHPNATDEQLDWVYKVVCDKNPDMTITLAMVGTRIQL